MKVLMLIWSYWPGPQGGAEKQCRLISPSLNEKGVEVVIVTAWLSYKTRRSEYDRNCKINRLGFLLPIILYFGKIFKEAFYRSSLNFSYILRLKDNALERKNIPSKKLEFWIELPFIWISRLIFICELLWLIVRKRKHYSIIHVHETGWLGAVGSLIGKIFKIPVVCKAATTPAFPVIGLDVPLSFILRKFQKISDIIVLNRDAQNELVLSGFPSQRISVIPNAVEIPDEEAQPRKSKNVLYVGNLSQGIFIKAFDILIGAWSIVAKCDASLKLIVAGGGDASELKEYTRKLGCPDSVEFAGFVENVKQLYLHAGLFLLPSRVEGMSNALLEALSFGLPAVVSDISANRAIADGNKAIVFVEVGNAEALASSILNLMKNSAKRDVLGRNGRQLVSRFYRVDVVTDQLLSLYRKLIFNF